MLVVHIEASTWKFCRWKHTVKEMLEVKRTLKHTYKVTYTPSHTHIHTLVHTTHYTLHTTHYTLHTTHKHTQIHTHTNTNTHTHKTTYIHTHSHTDTHIHSHSHKLTYKPHILTQTLREIPYIHITHTSLLKLEGGLCSYRNVKWKFNWPWAEASLNKKVIKFMRFGHTIL